MTDDPSTALRRTVPITVVIATRNRPELLKGALEAVNRVLRNSDAVIVVDSASHDAAAISHIASEAGATLIRCDQPGSSRARNAGWRAASSDIIAFTDDDCLPCDEWLDALVAAFDRTPLASFVTGRVVPEFTGSPRARLHLAVTSREQPALFDGDDDPADLGHGANMAWRKGALEELGGFDEGMGPGTALRAAEDVDVFWRALTNGGTGVFEPRATVAHLQWRSRAHHLRLCLGYGVGSGALAVKRWRLEDGLKDPDAKLSWRIVTRHIGRELLWRRVVHGVGRNIANRYAMGVLAELAMFAGEVRGVMRARGMPVSDGRFSASG
jgi:glycosyltransferase involved in cell wall biosynthesis